MKRPREARSSSGEDTIAGAFRKRGRAPKSTGAPCPRRDPAKVAADDEDLARRSAAEVQVRASRSAASRWSSRGREYGPCTQHERCRPRGGKSALRQDRAQEAASPIPPHIHRRRQSSRLQKPECEQRSCACRPWAFSGRTKQTAEIT